MSAAPKCRQAGIRPPRLELLGKPQDTALATRWAVPRVGRHRSVPVWRVGPNSFADDLGLSRCIVRSRAVPSLRSPEIHPSTLAFVLPGRESYPLLRRGAVWEQFFWPKTWSPVRHGVLSQGIIRREHRGALAGFELAVKM